SRVPAKGRPRDFTLLCTQRRNVHDVAVVGLLQHDERGQRYCGRAIRNTGVAHLPHRRLAAALSVVEPLHHPNVPVAVRLAAQFLWQRSVRSRGRTYKGLPFYDEQTGAYIASETIPSNHRQRTRHEPRGSVANIEATGEEPEAEDQAGRDRVAGV